MKEYEKIVSDFAPMQSEGVLSQVGSIDTLEQLRQKANINADQMQQKTTSSYDVRYGDGRTWLHVLHALTQDRYLDTLSEQQKNDIVRFATQLMASKKTLSSGTVQAVKNTVYVEKSGMSSTEKNRYVWQHWIDGNEPALVRLATQYAAQLSSTENKATFRDSSDKGNSRALLDMYERFSKSVHVGDAELKDLVQLHFQVDKLRMHKHEFKRILSQMLQHEKLQTAAALIEVIPQNPKTPAIKEGEKHSDVMQKIQSEQRKGYEFWSFGVQSSNREDLEICAFDAKTLEKYGVLFKGTDRYQKTLGLQVLGCSNVAIPIELSKKGYVWDSVSFAYACVHLNTPDFELWNTHASASKCFDSSWAWKISTSWDDHEVQNAMMDFLIRSNDPKKIQQARERYPKIEAFFESSKRVKDKWGDSVSPLYLAVCAGAHHLLDAFEPHLKGQKARLPDAISITCLDVADKYQTCFKKAHKTDVDFELVTLFNSTQTNGRLRQGVNLISERLEGFTDQVRGYSVEELRNQAVETKTLRYSLMQCALLSRDLKTIDFVLKHFDPQGTKMRAALDDEKTLASSTLRTQVEELMVQRCSPAKSKKQVI